MNLKEVKVYKKQERSKEKTPNDDLNIHVWIGKYISH